jgi:hypothetical protein
MKALIFFCLGMLMLFCSFGLFKPAFAGEPLNITDHSVERHFGDFNLDSIVDAKDALILEQNFGTHNLVADANNDGVVDILDALAVSRFYGFQLPTIEVNPYT